MENREIKEIHVFNELDDPEIEIVKKLLQIKECEAGTSVFDEGAAGYKLNIIASGKARVNKMTVEGDPFTITTLSDGDVFGIMTFLDGSRHDATVIAEQKTKLIQIEKSDFEGLLQSNPLIAYKILKRLAMHLTGIIRKMNREYMDLMHLMFRRSK
jgi:CRP-like cAMP-binding protein